MNNILTKLLMVFTILICTSGFASAQTQEQIAWVGVAIEDGSGKPPAEISPGVLSLEINNKQRPIEQVQHLTQRQVVVLLDLVLSSREGVNAARNAAWNYLNSLEKGDIAAIAALSQDKGVLLLSSFTSDPDQWAYALNHLDAKASLEDALGFRFSENAKERLSEAFIAEQQLTLPVAGKVSGEKVQEATGKFTKDLMQFSSFLSVARGRKEVLLFTPGFPDRKMEMDEEAQLPEDRELLMDGEAGDAEVREIPKSVTQKGESAADALANNFIASNSVVYCFDTSSYGQPLAIGKDFLKKLADKTRGASFENFQQGLESIKQVKRGQFLLGWKSFEPPSQISTIAVKAQSPIKVFAPTQILAPKPVNKFNEIERRLYLAHWTYLGLAPANPYFSILMDSFPLDKELSKSVIFVDIPGSRVMEVKSKTRSFYIASYLIDSKGKLIDYIFTPIRVDTDKSSEDLKKAGVRYFDTFLSSSGDYMVNGVIVDIERNEVTPFSRPYSVPQFTGFIVTAPVIASSNTSWVNIKHDYAKETKRNFVVEYPYEVKQGAFFPDAQSTIANGMDQYLYFRVYNLSLDKSKNPAPQLRFTLTPENGKEVPISDIQIADRVQLSDKDYALLLRFKVPNLPQGNFKLNAKVTDLLSKENAVGQRPVVVR